MRRALAFVVVVPATVAGLVTLACVLLSNMVAGCRDIDPDWDEDDRW